MNEAMLFHKLKAVVWASLVLPVVLFGAAHSFREAASWRPQLVATDPDGICEVNWARDGRVVRLDPIDLNQNLDWGSAYFDVRWYRRLADAVGKKRFVPPRYELRANYDAAPKEAPLFVVSSANGTRHPLRGTDWKSYGVEQFDATTSSWRFHASQFSPDEREISILSGRDVQVWSTQSGQRLRHATLQVPKKSVQSAVFSSNAKVIAARTLSSSAESDGKLAVFDATRGTKRFSMPSPENEGFGFSSANDVLWVATSSANKGRQLSFYDARNGHKLWNCRQNCATPPLFSPLRNDVFVASATGIQERRCRSGQVVQTFRGPVKNVYRMALTPGGSQIWSSHSDGQIWSWRVK